MDKNSYIRAFGFEVEACSSSDGPVDLRGCCFLDILIHNFLRRDMKLLLDGVVVLRVATIVTSARIFLSDLDVVVLITLLIMIRITLTTVTAVVASTAFAIVVATTSISFILILIAFYFNDVALTDSMVTIMNGTRSVRVVPIVN